VVHVNVKLPYFITAYHSMHSLRLSIWIHYTYNCCQCSQVVEIKGKLYVLYYNYSICLCDQSIWPVIFFSLVSLRSHEDVQALLCSMYIFIINGVTDLSLYLSPDSVKISQWHTLEQTHSTHSLWGTCRP